jgi:ribosomal protein S19
MSRVKWKGIFQDLQILNSLKKNKKKNYIRIWKRGSVITQNFLNKVVLVHTGKTFKKLHITRLYLGYRFGELCFTRKFTVKEKKVKKRK